MKRTRFLTMWFVLILTRGGLILTSSLATEPSAVLFSEPELKTLLTTTLQQEYVRDQGELELTLTRSWSAITVSNGPLTLKVLELPTLGVTASFIVRFELRAGDTSFGVWQMPVTAHVWREVWVARSNLRRGQPLPETDRTRERRDVLALRDAYLGDETDEARLEMAENVTAGSPLLTRQLRPRTIVRRGQVAEAVVRDGAMAVSLKVEVLEDGSIGQQVRVRNLQTKREFRGKVENEGTISVCL